MRAFILSAPKINFEMLAFLARFIESISLSLSLSLLSAVECFFNLRASSCRRVAVSMAIYRFINEPCVGRLDSSVGPFYDSIGARPVGEPRSPPSSLSIFTSVEIRNKLFFVPCSVQPRPSVNFLFSHSFQ